MIFSTIIISYCVLTLLLVYGWLKLDKSKEIIKPGNKKEVLISVLIPIRNEAKNILFLLKDLEKQTFKKFNFEVIIIDDNSEDDSAILINSFKATTDLNLKLLSLNDRKPEESPKKTAITLAIDQAKGKYIITTDGDCRVKPNWLTLFYSKFENTQATFISAPVKFSFQKAFPIWSTIQQIEFASLIGSGAASIALGKPNMCSGANIGYKKEAFIAVNGYEGNLHLASGDDEFLMHKIASKFPENICYLKDKEAIVETQPLPNIASFVSQRKRWASKWKSYNSFIPTLLAIFVFVSNVVFFICIISGNWNLVLLKLIPEFVFLFLLAYFFEIKKGVLFILPMQLFYPIYVVFFGIVSQFKTDYNWKGRKFK